MSDTVRRIEFRGFDNGYSLSYVRLSRNLEEIDGGAFAWCTKLIILQVPQHTELGSTVIAGTELIRRSLFETYNSETYHNDEEVNEWIKNINGDTEEYALHRACSSYNLMTNIFHGIVKRKGLKALKKKNEVGITPLEYLDSNQFTDISQSAIMKRYVLDMIGDVV
ncbi:predicted protein [Chaetoceros tenuissimus]|uniref:Uncharacterized protein n=1 Tax=Chaetoceros tenuissimus TaxID=426638 RepID=A0AAD3CFE2_9STRA|nr:predicted protein [Chaetoceros tenuissimus]